jgi:hypothetical protein
MLSVVMLIVIMLSVVTLSVIMLSVVMLSVAMLSVIMLSVIMLSVIVLSVVMLCVVMPIVVAPSMCNSTEAIKFLVSAVKAIGADVPLFSLSGSLGCQACFFGHWSNDAVPFARTIFVRTTFFQKSISSDYIFFAITFG